MCSTRVSAAPQYKADATSRHPNILLAPSLGGRVARHARRQVRGARLARRPAHAHGNRRRPLREGGPLGGERRERHRGGDLVLAAQQDGERRAHHHQRHVLAGALVHPLGEGGVRVLVRRARGAPPLPLRVELRRVRPPLRLVEVDGDVREGDHLAGSDPVRLAIRRRQQEPFGGDDSAHGADGVCGEPERLLHAAAERIAQVKGDPLVIARAAVHFP
mmetsp:Transcript_727/g.1884  ORF Transcript_727/g.1884 Transcript_727/m.1884 type:complete len:218 (-) Transcript_727:430-1083(-)